MASDAAPPRIGGLTDQQVIRQLRAVNARQAEQIVRLGNQLLAERRRSARLREQLDEAGTVPAA